MSACSLSCFALPFGFGLLTLFFLFALKLFGLSKLFRGGFCNGLYRLLNSQRGFFVKLERKVFLLRNLHKSLRLTHAKSVFEVVFEYVFPLSMSR
jgi:hypothetical protein